MNLQNCGAVAGDTVLCTASDPYFYEVGKEYAVTGAEGDNEVRVQGVQMGMSGHFVVVKPTSGWLPILSGQAYSSKYEFSYHNGVATHYRVVTPLVEVAEDRVRLRKNFINGIWGATTDNTKSANATLKGETHDGKPVGVWTITMDEE
mgnify:CR=1 FL=1